MLLTAVCLSLLDHTHTRRFESQEGRMLAKVLKSSQPFVLYLHLLEIFVVVCGRIKEGFLRFLPTYYCFHAVTKQVFAIVNQWNLIEPPLRR